MENLLQELIDVLEQQNATLADMLPAAKEHNAALRKNNPPGMVAAVMRLEEVSGTLHRQDKQREKLQHELAEELGLNRQARLSDILAGAGESPSISRLKPLAAEIKDKIEELSAINDINQALAARGLQFTSRFLNIIAPSDTNTYAGSGVFKNERSTSSVLNKTI
ncbi:hypothetical protein DCCM_0474 [Desulfocucumis palustris]|uniref:Flagellar protein FlgN n=1 Tax=Desulfocucumis palustris TaxID=1898651 RepID=A0A2L2X8D3_9FIRM|nr:flagellar protein FlgN [Desulfocucumis palustris]GBF32280.1 hypothetical protein DCCM_0474 [Desulfocucumis palustris]